MISRPFTFTAISQSLHYIFCSWNSLELRICIELTLLQPLSMLSRESFHFIAKQQRWRILRVAGKKKKCDSRILRHFKKLKIFYRNIEIFVFPRPVSPILFFVILCEQFFGSVIYLFSIFCFSLYYLNYSTVVIVMRCRFLLLSLEHC